MDANNIALDREVTTYLSVTGYFLVSDFGVDLRWGRV